MEPRIPWNKMEAHIKLDSKIIKIKTIKTK